MRPAAQRPKLPGDQEFREAREQGLALLKREFSSLRLQHEDLVQEASLKCAAQWDPTRPFMPYFLQALRNRAKDECRRKTRTQRTQNLFVHHEAKRPDDDADAESIVEGETPDDVPGTLERGGKAALGRLIHGWLERVAIRVEAILFPWSSCSSVRLPRLLRAELARLNDAVQKLPWNEDDLASRARLTPSAEFDAKLLAYVTAYRRTGDDGWIEAADRLPRARPGERPRDRIRSWALARREFAAAVARFALHDVGFKERSLQDLASARRHKEHRRLATMDRALVKEGLRHQLRQALGLTRK